jgi:hypothetical protein
MVKNGSFPCDFRMVPTYYAGRPNTGPSFWTTSGLMLSSMWSNISMVCILRSVLTKFEGQNVPMVENCWAPHDFRMTLTFCAGRPNKGPSLDHCWSDA